MNKVIMVLLFLFLSISANNIIYKQNKKLDTIVKNLDTILLKNDESAILDMIEELEELEKNDGYNPQTASYIGSLTSRLATFTWMPWSKLSYADKGSRIMNKAVKKSPNDIVVRFNRFFAYIYFPSGLKKESFIQQDVRFFLKAFKTTTNDKVVQNMATALSMFFLKQKDDTRYKKYYSMIKDDALKQRVILFKGKH
ncbi:hypothetical protein MNB_ARC-1_807 [hydrothermal vent metagenome]|uniref:Uncharacterized protein n=1 Tax=hydrothermal vent metagenome TaxID=652676 RepID=A0A3B1DUN6_9ZZZZ